MPGTPGNTTRLENIGTIIAMKTLAVTTVKALADFDFSAAEMAAADCAVVSTFTNAANLSRATGVTPTATFGIPLQAGVGAIVFEGNAAINALQVVSQSGTANVTIELSRY